MSRRIEACKQWLRQGWFERSAAISSGLLVAFAFPDFDIWPLAWFAYVPLLLVIRGKSGGVVFRLALLAGTTANFVGFFWMVNMLHRFGHLPLAVSIPIIFVGSIWQGVAIGGAVSIAAYINRKIGWPLWLVLPFVYSGFEAFHPILFPWFLGNCQYQLLWLIQVCDLLGVSFLTFLLVLANGVLAQLWTDLRARRYALSAAATLAPPATLLVVLALTLSYGAIRIEEVREQVAAAEKLKLGIIEPEIPIFEEQRDSFPTGTSPVDILKWNILSLQQWSNDLVQNEDVDLLIWPESTYFPALSTYARTWESRWLGAGEKLQRIGTDGVFLGRNQLQATALGGISAGESRTFLAGTGGAVWKIERETLVPEDSGSTEDLHAMAVACQRSVELRDTSADQCFVLAAGNGGALLVRSPKGWVRLKSDEVAHWRALATSTITGFVVGSENLVAVGDVSRGILATQKTPKDRWLKGVQTEDQGVLVSQRGTRAILKSGQSLRLEPAPRGLQGTVQDAAADSLGTILLASTKGLYGLREGQIRTFAEGSFARVACAAPGECLAATDEGEWFAADTKVNRVRPVVEKSLPPVALVGLPLSRHYWWLPADTTAVYRSSEALPSNREFPGGVYEDVASLVRDKNAVIRGFSTPLLFGATSGTLEDIEKPNSLENQRYNSAFLVDRDGEVLGRYDKQYLLAFGEHIPFGDVFPALYELSPDSGRFAPGPKQAPLEFKGHRLGVLVCYEDIIPAHTDAVVAQGAEVLLNLTNDAWFGKTNEPYQHFVLAAFRAVEQRRALVRATTTGISGVVSATGEIEHMTDLYDPETFVTEVPLLHAETIYRCGGRFFPNGCLSIAALMLLLAWRRRV